MKDNMPFVAALVVVGVWLLIWGAIVGTIIYIALHFIGKFW